MKNVNVLKLVFSVFFLTILKPSFSQNKNWTAKNLFEKRVFIENLGQFDAKSNDQSTKILYHSYTNGVSFYFTNKGLIVEGNVLTKRSRREVKQLLRAREASSAKAGSKIPKDRDEAFEENEKKELAYKEAPYAEEMKWVNANENARITVEGEVVAKYIYPNEVTKESMYCKAFKKLVYHDIYPNIDVEFYFPNDSSGFKYNYRVKSGVNPSVIAEKWLNSDAVDIDANGDISIKTPFGIINSKKPYSFIAGSKKPINTSYAINGNVISYSFADKTDGLLIIDPWTTVTTFGSTYNKGYDVDYDNAGNCYAYGGPAPFVLCKFDPAGTLVWSYAATMFGSTPTYGDFVTDHYTGSCYLVSAFSSPVNIIKLYNSGALATSWVDAAIIPEMWRIMIDYDTYHLIIGLGLTAYQIAYSDTTLTTVTPHDVIPSAYATDVVFMALDNSANCYFLYSYWSPSTYVNEIIKTPVPAFSSISYTVPSGHYFLEASSPKYGPPMYYMNGFNGLGIIDNSLFSYDSYVIKKRNLAAGGALLISKIKNLPTASDSSHMFWGGLAIDTCSKDVFIGSRDTVFQYDSMLVLKGTFPMPGTVIDIMLADGLAYVTGDGFVEAFEITPCGCSIVNTGLSVTHVSCNGLSDGSASFSPSGGIAPYTYLWTTLGTTDSAATGLAAGSYPVTLSDSTGCEKNVTVTVTQPSPLNIVVNPNSVNCFGNSATLVCLPTGGTGPYTVVWNNSIPVINDTLIGAAPGVYSITITDSLGCSGTFSDTLIEPTPLTGTLVSTNPSCDGSVLGIITANINGGTGPYTYAWSNDPSETSNIDSNLPGGIYGLIVTDDNGCTISLSDTIEQLIFPTISFTDVQPCFNGSNGTITATPTGGTIGETFVYSWNTIPVQNGLIANNVSAGTYILSVEANGCTFTFPFTINQNPIIDTLKINGIICGLNDFVTLYLPEQSQATYAWFNNGVLIPGATGSSYNSPIPDANFITATWYMGGCNYVTTTVETEEYPIVETKFIPNVFSPNNDLLNNLFYAFTFISSTSADKLDYLFEEFGMQIFNRWGQLIFETNDPGKGWDGKNGGDNVAEGVYFVMIKFKALCAEKTEQIIYNGTVQLVR